MATTNLQQNFSLIVGNLRSKDHKLTNIAKSMGYTTTTQLHSALEGESTLSTKAIVALIEQFNVNPLFLFLGKGDMFQTEETEVEALKAELRETVQRHNEALITILELNEMIKKLEKRNEDLIEISSAALKYHQGDKPREQKME